MEGRKGEGGAAGREMLNINGCLLKRRYLVLPRRHLSREGGGGGLNGKLLLSIEDKFN